MQSAVNLPPIDALWKMFIDPKDWQKSLELFPDSPWEFYLKPHGEYSQPEWDYFCSAVSWVWNCARRRELRKGGKLTLSFILSVNAILMTGDTRNWRSAIRNFRPIHCTKNNRAINSVYREGGTFYANPDGLDLRADGFWPEAKQSIDFFTACRHLSLASPQTDRLTWESALNNLKAQLYTRITGQSGEARWHIYFPSHPEEIEAQLRSIIQWYQGRIDVLRDRLAATGELSLSELLEVAVKVQRYLDITHFCMDGSGRTSKLISDFTFLQFGLMPPAPVLFQYENEYFENGTYLPLSEAIAMTELGWKER